jgi:uncharacterized protein (TIGR00251 family)
MAKGVFAKMKMTVTVKPNSKQESVEELPDKTYIVKANAPATDGKANKRVVELLAKFLGRPKTSIQLIKGHKAKIKTFELL